MKADLRERGAMTCLSPIQEFYTGQSVLVTGATGFIGKVLVEKLLRSCQGIKQIFLLIREKRGHGANERLASLLSKPLFDSVRRAGTSSGARLPEKLVALSGDLSEPGLGLSAEDRELLCREVTTVFHVAASVSFDEDIKTALKNNLWTTQEVTQLANCITNLKAFVYVSTAYSNCILNEVQEIVYDYRTELSSIYPKAQSLDVNEIESNEFLRRWPNTYTVTKALAEMAVEDNCKTMSAAILRPSIVVSSLKEPVPGWVDSFGGATMYLVSMGTGFMRGVCIGDGIHCDIVPVDMVANAIIAAAWDVSRCKPRNTPKVYNFVLGETNALKWDYFLSQCVDAVRRTPSITAKWYPFLLVCHTRMIFFLLDFWLHLVPSFLLDLPHILRTGKQRHFQHYIKYKAKICKVNYFLHKQWMFEKENVKRLLDDMTPEDRQTFSFDVREIKWRSLVRNYLLGIRRYLFKEADETLPYCEKHLHRLYLLHCSLIATVTISVAVPVFLACWKITFWTV